MPMFIERFLLPVFAGAVILLALSNPMKFDITQRVTGALAIVSLALFVAHTAYKKPSSLSTELPSYSQRANVEVVALTFPTGAPSGIVSDPFAPGTTFFINVGMKNTGAVPANRYAAMCRISLTSISTEKQDQENLFKTVKSMADESPYGDNSLPPSKESFFSAQYPLAMYGETALTADDIAQIQNRTRQIAISGVIKYLDDYGPRETHFCFSFQGRTTEFGKAVWNDCYGHNSIFSPERE